MPADVFEPPAPGEVGSLPLAGEGQGEGYHTGAPAVMKSDARNEHFFLGYPSPPPSPARGEGAQWDSWRYDTGHNGRPFWNLLPCPARNRRELSVRHSYTTTTCSISHLTAGTS
ncbi:hypothetical protein ABIB87_002234 [Bradyrhizobium sp. JR18.2]